MKKNQKALLIAVGDFPEGSATAARLKLIAKALKIGGISVKIALIHATISKEIPENHSPSGKIDGIEYVYLNGQTVRPKKLLKKYFDTIGGINGVLRLLDSISDSDQRPDFIIFYTPYLVKCGLPIWKAVKENIPVFVEICEIHSSAIRGSKNSALREMFKSLEWILEYLIPKFAYGIIPISEKISNYYKGKGLTDQKILLLPILVEPELYVYPSTSEVSALLNKNYYLSAGSFTEKEGIEFILAAFSQVAGIKSGLYLAFTGRVGDQNQKKVRDILTKDGLQEHVIFVGQLTRNELVWAYQNALALLCCRTNSKYANFGVPTKLGEYLASGSPVIATKVGDTQKYLIDGKTAFLADAENSDSIASCMINVVENQPESVSIGRRGQEISMKMFNYSSYSQPLLNFIYNRLPD